MFPAKLTCMNKIPRFFPIFVALIGLLPPAAGAQTFPSTGTRAQGMGGAFVGVAADGTALYWNPAGLASGSYFSLVVDGGAGEAIPAGQQGGRSGNFLIGASMPALGLGYYRLKATAAV